MNRRKWKTEAKRWFRKFNEANHALITAGETLTQNAIDMVGLQVDKQNLQTINLDCESRIYALTEANAALVKDLEKAEKQITRKTELLDQEITRGDALASAFRGEYTTDTNGVRRLLCPLSVIQHEEQLTEPKPEVSE